MISKVVNSSINSNYTFYCFNQVPVVLNGLLVSQRLPTIDMKNPVDSLTKVFTFSIVFLLSDIYTYIHANTFRLPIKP